MSDVILNYHPLVMYYVGCVETEEVLQGFKRVLVLNHEINKNVPLLTLVNSI